MTLSRRRSPSPKYAELSYFTLLCFAGDGKKMYIEDLTRWREDMNFMLEWREQYLTSERSERVRYCSCHENIKFLSLS